MGLSDHRLLSAPHRVIFAGWESDTYSLQRAGWQLASEQEPWGDSIRLLLKHNDLRMKMLTAPVPHRYMQELNPGQTLVFRVQQAAADFVVQLMETQFNFKEIDAKPMWVSDKRMSVDDFNIFANHKHEQIIVEPESVAECLELIRRLQAPDLERIRKDNARREAANQILHAQVLSIAA